MGCSDAYKAFDGTMKNCRGAECASSCCDAKTITDLRGREASYRTTMNPTEHVHQLEHFGNFPQGVSVQMHDVIIGATKHQRFLIENCLGDNGSCKLANRKPIQCRIFPFTLSAERPLQTRLCPEALSIGSEPGLREKILAVREELGHGDTNFTWNENLDRELVSKDTSEE